MNSARTARRVFLHPLWLFLALPGYVGWRLLSAMPIGPIGTTAGIVLLIFGFNASNSLGSDISRFFTGSPTDRAVWMIAGGECLTSQS